MLSPYVPIVTLFALAAAFAVFSVTAAPLRRAAPLQPRQARLLRVRHRADAAAGRRQPVPGQVLPDRDALHRLRHRDIFLYPWAVASKNLGMLGLVEIVLFIATVFIAYAYVWRRGGLDWD